MGRRAGVVMDYQLPFDQTIIQRILPHRYPFLLVDRITEFEPDTRIVGIKNVAAGEQVLAIMILAKPENRDKLIFFMGIDHVRFRKPVYAGDQVVITATVKRLRAKMGWLHGIARVNGEVCAEGTMTFALGAKGEEIK
jgi:3-hydroxyacyl-[acyl-carrier-protein] dehydratase